MIHRIVLSGGPCGGKSTALPLIAEHYRKQGYNVLTTPEMATLFFNHGIQLAIEPPEYHRALETTAFKVQLEMEDGFAELAHHGNPSGHSILLHDRGLVDLAAYCSPEMWEEITAEYDFTPEGLRDWRYDLVLHFKTVAHGAEQFFTLDNNPARQCTPELARILDDKSRAVWIGHPRCIVLDNSTGFSEKLGRAIQSIDTYLQEAGHA